MQQEKKMHGKTLRKSLDVVVRTLMHYNYKLEKVESRGCEIWRLQTHASVVYSHVRFLLTKANYVKPLILIDYVMPCGGTKCASICICDLE